MVRFSPSIFITVRFIIARLRMWVHVIMNGQLFTRVKHLLTNCLHGKAAELCLALTAEITA